MLPVAGQEQQLQGPVERPSTAAANTGTLDTSFNKQWAGPSKLAHCHVRSVRDVT
jgi:hypothetical protein